MSLPLVINQASPLPSAQPTPPQRVRRTSKLSIVLPPALDLNPVSHRSRSSSPIPSSLVPIRNVSLTPLTSTFPSPTCPRQSLPAPSLYDHQNDHQTSLHKPSASSPPSDSSSAHVFPLETHNVSASSLPASPQLFTFPNSTTSGSSTTHQTSIGGMTTTTAGSAAFTTGRLEEWQLLQPPGSAPQRISAPHPTSHTFPDPSSGFSSAENVDGDVNTGRSSNIGPTATSVQWLPDRTTRNRTPPVHLRGDKLACLLGIPSTR